MTCPVIILTWKNFFRVIFVYESIIFMFAFKCKYKYYTANIDKKYKYDIIISRKCEMEVPYVKKKKTH